MEEHTVNNNTEGNKTTVEGRQNLVINTSHLALDTAEDIHNYYQKIINCMSNSAYWTDKQSAMLGSNDDVLILKLMGIDSSDQLQDTPYEKTYEKISETVETVEIKKEEGKQDEINPISSGKTKFISGNSPVDNKKEDSAHYISSQVPIMDENSHVIGMINVSLDMSERKKTEQALRKAKEDAEVANHAKSYFIASIGHEFRTPLNHIIGLSAILKTSRDCITASEQEEYLEAIHKAGNDLLGLINDVMLFSRMEIGAIKIDSQKINLRCIINKLIRNYAHRIEDKNLKLEIDYADDVPVEVMADPQRVRQVLIHLLDNAIKFTVHGRILIHVKLDTPRDGFATRLQISVTDTGIGIDEQKLGLLFEKFSQVHSEYTDQRMGRYRGVGLGLAISKELVELMGGEISVTSKLGHGATFTFTLPLAKPYVHEQAAKADVKTDIALGGRLLLVEDDHLAQRFAKVILEENQCQVDVAATGQEALEMLEKNNYALVFMDVGLPDIKGTQVTAEFRRREGNNRHTPIVALSAQELDEGESAALAAGMDGYLVKPLNDEKLRLILNRWVRKAQTV